MPNFVCGKFLVPPGQKQRCFRSKTVLSLQWSVLDMSHALTCLSSHASIFEFCIDFNAIILVPTAFGRVYPISIILISRVLGLQALHVSNFGTCRIHCL